MENIQNSAFDALTENDKGPLGKRILIALLTFVSTIAITSVTSVIVTFILSNLLFSGDDFGFVWTCIFLGIYLTPPITIIGLLSRRFDFPIPAAVVALLTSALPVLAIISIIGESIY